MYLTLNDNPTPHQAGLETYVHDLPVGDLLLPYPFGECDCHFLWVSLASGANPFQGQLLADRAVLCGKILTNDPSWSLGSVKNLSWSSNNPWHLRIPTTVRKVAVLKE